MIITSNPLFQALGVQAIAGQEWLKAHRQLWWRLDASPSSLHLH